MSSENQTVVSVKTGKLEGEFKNGVYAFKGIPYAAPPVGDLRWLPPQPPVSWSGVRPAGQYGAMAPQNLMAAPSDSPGSPDFGDVSQEEDCLFLNVWTPGLDNARRPVLFWIHGGAFIIGAGSESFLDNGSLVKRGDIVLVSINYRLGPLGFMNLNEITGGKIPATGNEGLLDQVAALEWVRDNIAAFGGDPDNVTVSGFSAGGMSVGTLLGFPAAAGLFQKAMNRSGAANIVGTLERAVEISAQFIKVLGLKRDDADGMRNLTVQQLLDGQQQLGEVLRQQENRATPFQPVVDGGTLPEFPMTAIRKGSAKGVTLMAGNSRDELKAMNAMNPALNSLDEAGLIENLNKIAPPEIVPGLVNAYRASMQQGGAAVKPQDILGSVNTDVMFRIPTIRLVEAQRDIGERAYNYLFAWKSPAMGGALGAMHGLDNPFLFGSLDARFTGNGPDAESLSTKLQDSCAAFMHTGDPSCESAGKWSEYGTDRMTMIWDKEARVEAAPYEEERRAWDDYDIISTTPM